MQIHDAQASIKQEDLPVTWLPPLPAGSLQLPFAEGDVHDITSLFADPRRGPGGWDPNQRGLGKHEGIDWGCPEDKSVRAMIAGSVVKYDEDHPDSGYGNYVTVRTNDPDQDLFFTLTYAHLKSVTKKGGLVAQDEEVGISGNTGNSSGPHLHVHYIAEGKFSTVNWPDFFYFRNYQDFQAGLPPDIYRWPDIAALQAEIDAAPSAARDILGRWINVRMGRALYGTATPRLWVKPGAKVYMIPEADARFRYPSQPLAGYEITGKSHTVRNPNHPDTDVPSPVWWRIERGREDPDTPYSPPFPSLLGARGCGDSQGLPG